MLVAHQIDLQLAEAAQLAYVGYTHRNNATSTEALMLEGDGLVTVAFRGTDGLHDMFNGIRFYPWWSNELACFCHRGFLVATRGIYDRLYLSIQQSIHGKLLAITGHSLGGAIACLTAALLQRDGVHVARLTTFGAPRVAYPGLADWIGHIPGGRYVCDGDSITAVPPWWLGYLHDRDEITLPGAPGILNDHGMGLYLEGLRNAC